VLDDVELDLSSIQYALIQQNVDMIEIKKSLDEIHDSLGSIVVTDAATVVNPVSMNIKPIVPEKTYLGYMFPALVILVVMFISILLSTTLVMMEKHSPAHFRNFITPTRNITFVVSTYLTSMLIVVIQLGIILGISSYFLKMQIVDALLPSLSILLLGTTFFTFAGMFIGYIFTSEETATLAAISVGSIFLFLSNVILPIESMPAYIEKIARFNPFVLGEGLLRQSIVFKVGFGAMLNEIYLLLGYIGVLFVLILIFHALSGKGLFSGWMKEEENKKKP
jgi:ABC-type multidrug transport system permease subunit